MFIDPTSMEFDNKEKVIREKGKLWAIVKGTTTDPRSNAAEYNKNRTRNQKAIKQRPNDFCKLVKSFKVEDELRIISVNAIKRNAFVITDVDKVYRNNKNNNSDTYFGSSSIYCGKNVLLLKDREEWADEFINSTWD